MKTIGQFVSAEHCYASAFSLAFRSRTNAMRHQLISYFIFFFHTGRLALEWTEFRLRSHVNTVACFRHCFVCAIFSFALFVWKHRETLPKVKPHLLSNHRHLINSNMFGTEKRKCSSLRLRFTLQPISVEPPNNFESILFCGVVAHQSPLCFPNACQNQIKT